MLPQRRIRKNLKTTISICKGPSTEKLRFEGLAMLQVYLQPARVENVVNRQ